MTKCYDEKETMPQAMRERYFNEKLQWIVRHGYAHAPAIREKLDKARIAPSDICTAKDFAAIPVTKRDDVIQRQKKTPPFGGFLAIPLSEVKHTFIFPGPMYEPLPIVESISRALWAAGNRKGDILLNAVSYHLVPTGYLIEQAARRLGLVVIPGGVGNTDLQVEVMRHVRVTSIAVAPSLLTALIEKAEEKGYNFSRDFVLKKAFFVLENCHELKKRLQEQYGIDSYQGYGSDEFGVVASECTERNGMHFCEEYFIEVVDPLTGKRLGPGEVGEVVITPFNEAFPLLRFATGDLFYYMDEPCPCDRTSPRLSRFLGRVGEAVKP